MGRCTVLGGHALAWRLAVVVFLLLALRPVALAKIQRFRGQKFKPVSLIVSRNKGASSISASRALECRRALARHKTAVAAHWRANKKRCYFYASADKPRPAQPTDVAFVKSNAKSNPKASPKASPKPSPTPAPVPAGSAGGGKGAWSGPYKVDVIPVAAAMLHNGKVLLWSNWDNSGAGKYKNPNEKKTHTTIWDPKRPTVRGKVVVTKTNHDMFCPGLVTLADGRVHVAGGASDRETSIYNPKSNSWARAELGVIGRGYQSNVVLGDGRVFTIGGSWSGKVGGKSAEIWTPGKGWKSYPKIKPDPILTDDVEGIYRADNHAWIFAWKNNKVLHAGPSAAMHVFDVRSSATKKVGTRGKLDQMNGGAVMHTAGKILTLGGAPDYSYGVATRQAHEITIQNLDTGSVTVQAVGALNVARSFACVTVLPDGKVVVTGGQKKVKLFSDDNAELTAELYDPATKKFSLMAKMKVPRTYHSVALLLPDGRVMTGGGGLCGNCKANHYDVEVFTPPYLMGSRAKARPVIKSISQGAPRHGQTVTVTTSKPVQYFALIRTGSSTHALNSDQRRLVPNFSKKGRGDTYDVKMPQDPGLAPPGYYMLFAMDFAGVPSVSTMILLR